MIYSVIHVTQHNIRTGTFTCVHHFHTKLGTSDPPSDQRCIKDDRLDKSILRPSQRLILIRFFHTSRGISSGIDQDTSVIAVNKECKHP